MTLISAIIVEDEYHDSELLKAFLSEIEDIEILAVATDENEALQKILLHTPDLIFFDINLNGTPALDTLQALKNANIKSKIIFTTAYEEYAMKVFEYSNLPYLLKPIDKDKLFEVICNFRNQLNNITKNKTNANNKNQIGKNDNIFENLNLFPKIEFRETNNIIYLRPLEILYCEADGGYTKIFTYKNSFSLATSTLRSVQEKLPKQIFERIHDAFLINKEYLCKFDTKNNKCHLKKEEEKVILDVSRRKRGLFKGLFK